MCGRDKAHIIIEPVDGSHLLDVSFALEVWRVLVCVEIEDVSSIASVRCGKEMSSVTELDLCASFDLNVFKWLNTLGQNVVEGDLILNSHNHMESTWVECNCEGIFWHSLRDLKGFGNVVPNFNCSVPRACDDELLSNTDIKTSDIRCMVATVNEINF